MDIAWILVFLLYMLGAIVTAIFVLVGDDGFTFNNSRFNYWGIVILWPGIVLATIVVEIYDVINCYFRAK